MLSPQARIALKAAWAVFLFTCLALRFWILRKRFRTSASIASDVCVAAAWTVLVPTAGLLIYEDTKYLHWYNTPKSERVIFNHPLVQPDVRHIHFAMIYLYLLGLWLLKAAFVSLYFDLFPRRSGKAYRFNLYALTTWIILAFLALMLLCTFICMPVSENWDILPTCNVLTSRVTLYVSYSLNISTDLWILGLPLALVRSLRLDFREKVGFIFVIMVGLASICASTARFAAMYRFRQEWAMGDFSSLDKYGDLILNIEDWSLAETWTALFAFCLPSFKVFLKRSTQQRSRVTPGTSSLRTSDTTWVTGGPKMALGASWRSKNDNATAEALELGNFTEIHSTRSLGPFTPPEYEPERIP